MYICYVVSHLVALLLTLSCVIGCGHSDSAKKQVKPVKAEELAPEQEVDQLDMELVFHNIFQVPVAAGIAPELLNPNTVLDAQNIVRSDNIALYARADKIFEAYLEDHSDDLENLTWHAQLYLAWADSAAITTGSLKRNLVDLSSQQDKHHSVKRQRLIDVTQKVIGDLEQLAQTKLTVGSKKTLAILKKNPDSYEGFRLGVDLFRQLRQWEKYNAYLAKLKKLNPKSNGLLFAQGVVAFQRDKDFHSAESFLKQALANDAGFVKAQYYLALTYLNMKKYENCSRELRQTLKLSPGHPFANAMQQYLKRLDTQAS